MRAREVEAVIAGRLLAAETHLAAELAVCSETAARRGADRVAELDEALRARAAARAAALADGTWVRVEGTIPAGQGDSSMRSTPTMQVVAVQEIEAPENPYSY